MCPKGAERVCKPGGLMSKVGWEARVGALAFMAGLSWVGLQASGVANAESGDTSSASASASAKHATVGSRTAPSQRKPARPHAAVAGPAVRARSVSGVASARLSVDRPATAAVATSAPSARPAVSAAANPIQDFFDHVSLLIRRTFFNQPPKVNPVQITGEHEGVITGTIGVVDPEGDPIKYTVLRAGRDLNDGTYSGPYYGTLKVEEDGTFTYTPGSDFTGTDDFRVIATDAGPHINLLNLFRPSGTTALVEVNQYAVGTPPLRFSFTYDSESEAWWTPAAKAALEAAAQRLASYIVPMSSHPVTVTYNVAVDDSLGAWTLAHAGSTVAGTDYYTNAVFDDFNPTVVQHKILAGVDQNGPAFDGHITFDSSDPWTFTNDLGLGVFDFQSVALHELMHTFGFMSGVGAPGANYGSYGSTFDSFLVTSSGVDPFGSTGAWDVDYDANLTGGNGGLYFGGPNAVAAYGGLVPLYTPSYFDSSSLSHLDRDTFSGSVMSPTISSGSRNRLLSAVELGILKDLGYTIAD
ncbi:peptidase M10A and M12B matrixin and adamalysin [Mycolicibacterium rhodesiae JS60]|nr:peptidase M10A and M12B matrixin and adamalysin [Mycolicibacterium rhodesiae JS60]